MRTRQSWGAVLVGLALTAAGAAVPAPATADVVSAVPSTVTAVLSAGGPNHQPAASNPHRRVHKKHHKIPKARNPHKANRGHGKHAVTSPTPPATAASTKAPHSTNPPSTTPSARTSHATTRLRSVPDVTPTAPTSPRITSPRPRKSSQLGDAVQQVTSVLQTVVKPFGWNLLTLIPMAGIAFAISRRMSAAGRADSTRLPPLHQRRN